ncbi:MAG: TIGR03619 family F420-dependent LLM class oxidoreductase [Actinomycetota bacterium]
MRFGVGLPVAQHPVPAWASSLEAIGAVARAASAAGFEHVFVTDHPAPPARWLAAGGHSSLDPFVALTAAAAADPDIRLLTNLSVLAYRHPLVLAKSAASLDRLSGGRLTLGVGVGYLAAEFDALGVPFDERNDRFDRALDVLDAIWRGDGVEITEGDGRTSVVVPDPLPVQAPIPIWIGGNAGRTRQRVAERAQGWMPMPNPAAYAKTTRSPVLDGPEDLARFVADLHRRADEVGRTEPIDIVFVVPDGGQPGSARFDVDAHRRAIATCRDLGVTGNNVTLATTSLEHTLDVIGRYGAEVIETRG